MSPKLVALFLCLGCVSIAHGQNVLVNGNFETTDANGTVTGWDVTGNVAAVNNQGSNTPSYAAALSVGHDSQGDMLSQTFATMAGQTYTLDFYAGVYGEPSAGPLSLQVQVNGTGSLLDQTVAPPNNNDFGPAPFNPYSYMFTADSTSTTLKFTDIGSGNASADVMVDTVSVSEVPEPASWTLILVGGLVAAASKRRRSGVPAA